MKNSVQVYLVRAFTDEDMGGSPTAVVLDADGLLDHQMQWIAQQFDVSHTAFVIKTPTQESDVHLRFFTPTSEIQNCAHATVAAHFLLATHKTTSDDFIVKQKTQSGLQTVQVSFQGGRPFVVFEQNEIKFHTPNTHPIHQLLSLFRLSATDLMDSFPVLLASPGAYRFLLPLRSKEALFALQPDFPALLNLCRQTDSIGCFAFVVAGANSKWTAWGRMFAPAIGVNEDVVNGNSSGCVGAYLLNLTAEKGKDAELALTVSQGHTLGIPGNVTVKAQKYGSRIKTFVGGSTVFMAKREVEIE